MRIPYGAHSTAHDVHVECVVLRNLALRLDVLSVERAPRALDIEVLRVVIQLPHHRHGEWPAAIGSEEPRDANSVSHWPSIETLRVHSGISDVSSLQPAAHHTTRSPQSSVACTNSPHGAARSKRSHWRQPCGVHGRRFGTAEFISKYLYLSIYIDLYDINSV